MDVPRIVLLRWTLALAAACLGPSIFAAQPDTAAPPLVAESEGFRAPPLTARPPGAAAPPLDEPAGTLTADQALALALLHSPELALFSWEVRAGEAHALEAGSTPNPEIDFRLFRVGVPRNDSADDEARKRVILTHELELGGKRQRRIDLARTESALAEWDYRAARNRVASSVATRFVEVLAAQQSVDSRRQALDFAEQMQQRAGKLVQTGALRSLETHRADRIAGLSRIELQRAEGRLAAARFGLAALWGSSAPRFSAAVGDLEPGATLLELQTVLALAAESPDVARWETELARGGAALALARSGRVPDLQYGVGVRWENGLSQRDYIVDLAIELPIFDTRRGEIREARAEMARALAGRRAAAADAGRAIAELYFAARSAREAATILRNEVLPAARQTFEAYRRGFETDVTHLDRVLDARHDLARTEIDYLETLVEYHTALDALEGLVGRRLEAEN